MNNYNENLISEHDFYTMCKNQQFLEQNQPIFSKKVVYKKFSISNKKVLKLLNKVQKYKRKIHKLENKILEYK